MLSERAKIQYAKNVYRRRYTGSSQIVGPLASGKFYRITQFKSGDDFSNVGVPESRCWGTKGSTGVIFEATGTTPNIWTNGSKLTELKVAELRAFADENFNIASAQVVITGASFEGGQGSGPLVFEKSIDGVAIEQLLAEMDPDYVHTTPFPRRVSGITVRL